MTVDLEWVGNRIENNREPIPGRWDDDKGLWEKFHELTGRCWPGIPDLFCREISPLDPEFIGRFYGENRIKACALEIFRVNGRIACRYAWTFKATHAWVRSMALPGSNRYRCLEIKKRRICSIGGLNFRKRKDGQYALGYKTYPELMMVKLAKAVKAAA